MDAAIGMIYRPSFVTKTRGGRLASIDLQTPDGMLKGYVRQGRQLVPATWDIDGHYQLKAPSHPGMMSSWDLRTVPRRATVPTITDWGDLSDHLNAPSKINTTHEENTMQKVTKTIKLSDTKSYDIAVVVDAEVGEPAINLLYLGRNELVKLTPEEARNLAKELNKAARLYKDQDLKAFLG